MTRRAAIYARFSSDRQRDRSIDDQVALCRELATRHGWQVMTVYADRAITGSIVQRREFARMLADAGEGLFDIVLAEDVDRLARGEGDAPKLRQHLEFLGIEIHTTTDGHITKLHAGLKGLMSSLFLDNLAAHTKRGMAGVVRDGRHAGGRPYGYRLVPGKPGELAIDPAEAAIVQRIFERYVAGQIPRQIAGDLNRDGVVPPRAGSTWRASTINGNSQRHNGILQNEIYAGSIVWNKVRMLRDPATGKRVIRPNAESEHKRADAPHLRIIALDLFQAAQAHKRERAHLSRGMRRRAKRLLSGLLRCGCCGGGMSATSTGAGKRPRLVCTKMREAGTCENKRNYYLDEIEHRVIDGLRTNLGSREAIQYFVDTYNAERRRSTLTARRQSADLERKLAAAERDLKRAIDGMIRGTLAEAEADRIIPGLRQERDRLAGELADAAQPPKVVALHPPSVDAYLAAIDKLAAYANGHLAGHDEEVAQALRKFIDSVTVIPAGRGEMPELRLAGGLASLLPGQAVAGARYIRQKPLSDGYFAFAA